MKDTLDDYSIGMTRLIDIATNRGGALTDTGGGRIGRMAERNVCMMCGHTWKKSSVRAPPRVCPACRSSLWNCKDIVRHTCLRCGHSWNSHQEDPLRCPGCKSKIWNKCIDPPAEAEDDMEALSPPVDEDVLRKVLGPSASPDGVLSVLQTSQNDSGKAVALVDKGFSVLDAEIVLRNERGIDAVTIALDTGATFSHVMKVTRCINSMKSSSRGR